MNNWEKAYQSAGVRTGLRLRFDKNVDAEVVRALKDFVRWLRSLYTFPVRVPVYVKSSAAIKAMDGELVRGTFFRPYDKYVEPYIRIAAGNYKSLASKRGVDNALASYLFTLAHELTHYFQWVNDIPLTLLGEERQATRYAGLIMGDYALTRDHP